MVLVREQLIQAGGSHPLWSEVDFTQFPWPMGRTLWDLVARLFQEEFLRLAISEKHYYRLLGQVEIAVFGKTNPEREMN